MTRRKSNQRITKIKRDYILDLLQRAEATSIEDACSIQPAGSDLTPYPDLNNLRLWTRDHLLKGVTKIFPVNVDDNGQTYYTCLIDGLPLHTKLTKQTAESSTQLASFVNKIGNPTISADGFASNLDSNNYFTITDSSKIASQGSTTYIAVSVPSNVSNAVIYQAQFSNVTYTCKLINSSTIHLEDNTTYTQNTLSDVDITEPLRFNFYYYNTGTSTTSGISVTYTETSGSLSTQSLNYVDLTQPTGNCQSLLICNNSTVISGLSINLNNSNSGGESFFTTIPGVELSKPGLWLSNLVAPISNSIAGSYLKHNFIHSSQSSFSTVNSDVIGNYSYSYFQRGIIHRTDGSTHDGNDSYCQHWSPSALSCISHDAIIIPLNNLRSTYTSYQTYVVPSDPNMQRYDETPSKDVEFYFVDNNNNEPLTTTEFNGRVVGDGWTYELVFTPNGNGSGNDYGEGTNPSAPNGSNGGCITGQITYQDSLLGTSCTQQINSCFETNQSYFNPLVPDVPEKNPINDASGELHTVESNCCVARPWGCSTDFYCSTPIGTEVKVFLTGSLSFADDNTDHVVTTTYYSCPATTSHCVCNTYLISGLNEHDASGDCACYQGTINWYDSSEIPEENDISIYAIVTDLKKQSEAEGVPWDDNNCGNARFHVGFSTQPCEAFYCTNFLLAENADINSLGDISYLNTINLSNVDN